MYDAPIAVYDASTHKFTGKERDSESGLDMFGARYYGSSPRQVHDARLGSETHRRSLRELRGRWPRL